MTIGELSRKLECFSPETEILLDDTHEEPRDLLRAFWVYPDDRDCACIVLTAGTDISTREGVRKVELSR